MPARLRASPLLGLLAHRDDKDIIDFAMGSPLPLRELPLDLFTLPPDEYAALVHDRLYYPLGLPTARQAVASYYCKAGLPTRPEQVLITNGAQHAIALCAALYLQRGDSVLVEDPAYFGALDAFRVAGARVSPLPVEAGGVPIGVLRDRIIATAARLVYLTPTFQNPTGAVMPVAARKEVARIASELAIPVIDDGALAEMALDGPTAALDRHLCAFRADAHDRVAEQTGVAGTASRVGARARADHRTAGPPQERQRSRFASFDPGHRRAAARRHRSNPPPAPPRN